MNMPMLSCPCPVVAEAFRTHTLPGAGGKAVPTDVYIPREQGDLLYSLVRHHRPAVTVEVGMANGLSTLFLARGHRDNGGGSHVAIDPFQRTEWAGAGLADLVRLVELPSHQALPDLEREGLRPGLVFVDGSHLFDYVMTDFLCADRMLEVAGLMAFDDSDWPSVRAVLRFAVTNRRYSPALPDVVIEGERYTPRAATRLARWAARRLPPAGRVAQPSFLRPDAELGLRGRCVVLRKDRPDDRDSQSQHFVPF